ncbi:Inhibitor of sigma-G Gin [Anaerovirgula multivorans]|uniref:Inhibitor of sigma-G Gin n=2 Tax=Anaerovirgula multivorans TaxID=312168 RepID=A0A239ELV4_9FIRM|nr:Inhibitor of sigma-G Gin [Anaerovirgula multivorans]
MSEGLQCCICNGKTSTGIVLLNQYICGNCEREMIHTPIDQLKYEVYKKKIKNIWKQFLKKA